MPTFRRSNARVYVVWDGLEKPDLSVFDFEFYDWRDIPLWGIPHKTDMIRSWGIYRSWVDGNTYTLTLDDDVRPRGQDLIAAYERVFNRGLPFSEYVDVGAFTSFDGQLRGFPYRDRRPADVAVQYGGWEGVLDYDAATQLVGVPGYGSFRRFVFPVPKNALVTTCIMNAAWRTTYAPIMWQLPLIDGRYNRFGDIWSGVFQKRVLDVLGKVMAINGDATVLHRRASDPVRNLEREAPGIEVNERIANVKHPSSTDLIEAYREVTDSAAHDVFDPNFAVQFMAARDEWLSLFT